ncbi:MAG: hypothetical protein Q8862_10205, partial [Bacteroidota bacterium]|nr:hypothetical protein [Bacteroidota bacterium]
MKYWRLILFTLIALIITDSFRYISWVGALNISNSTYITTFLNYLSLCVMIFIAYKSSWDKDVSESIIN